MNEFTSVGSSGNPHIQDGQANLDGLSRSHGERDMYELVKFIDRILLRIHYAYLTFQNPYFIAERCLLLGHRLFAGRITSIYFPLRIITGLQRLKVIPNCLDHGPCDKALSTMCSSEFWCKLYGQITSSP